MKESNLVDDTAILAQICEQCNLSPHDIEDAYPCTPVQSGMMVDSALYVHTIVHKVDSSVDLNQLSHALDQVVAMNHVLRTRIVDCDDIGLLQAVVRKGEPVLQSEERDFQYFLKWNNSLSTELGTPLVRFAIVTGGDGTRLITTMHHVIFDLHVLESLIEDTWSVYHGISPPERPPFKNFVNHCNSINPKEAAAFWKKHFAGGASTFPPVPAGHQPIAREIITREISISQQKTQKTPSMALMPAYIEAAWALTVSDYTNNDSVAFGYILSGRGAGMPGGAETTFGPTITSVPIQVDIRRSMTTHQLVKERVASRRELSTSSFLQFGLANIRNVNEATRNAANFQSALSIVHRSHMKGLGTSGLILDEAFTEEPPKPHGLLLICTPGEKHVHIKTLFDPEVLEPEQVHRILRQLDHRLRQLITSAPSTPLKRLTCLNFGDTLEIMDWNSRRFPTEPMKDCLHSRIAARATDQPNDLAVTSWDGEAAYDELITMVDNLALEILASHGDIAAEEPVCIMIGRSLSLTVALLAVMRVGGICVPIDPNLPKARKEAIITQCQARLILTPYESPREIYEYGNNCMLLPVVPDRHANAAKTAELPPDDAPASRAAFMIFTSGSTGHPKGVVLEHKSYVSSLKAWTDVVGWKRGARVLQYSTPSFDACAGEIMGTFQAGACLCIPSDLDRESGLGDYIRSNSVNYVGLTPTTLRSLSPQDVLPALKSVASAGEPITRKVFETWSDKVHLVNAWGPTEASIVASVGDLTPDTRYPDTIGTPLGCALWIVDPEDMNRLLPIGSVGEMLIDGPGVAREYYLAPELTKASFVKPPSFLPKRGKGLDSSRLYRTGDLARYNADGTICFHGRRDNQVKIRGQRFELGEVESALASHQSISDVIVTTYQKGSGSVIKDVVVVFTFSSHPKQQVVDVSESKSEVTRIALDKSSRQQLRLIQDFAKDRFPTYMVPTVWLVVRELPHTPSKKVDRVKIKAWLATIDMSAVRESSQTTVSQQNQGYRTLTPPTTPAEVILQQTWSNVLHIDSKKIGRESSFMRLGGDSITAMQVATRCRRKGFQIAVADLLRKSTLAESATEIQPIRNTLPVIIPTMNVAEESQLHPLSPVQKFLFEGNGPASHNQFNQAFLLDISPSMGIEVSPSRIKRALERIVAHHPMLRCRFFHGQDAKGKVTLEQRIAPLQNQGGQSTWAFRFHPNISSNEDLWNVVSTSQASLNIFDGPVFSADVIITPQGQTSLFLVAHHLVIDLVSWRILWEDLEAILKDESCILPQSFPFLLWVQGQRDMQKGDMTSSTSWPKADYRFWKMEGLKPKVKDMLRLQHTLSQKQTEQIMGESCNTPFSTTPVILLLGAVVSSFLRVFPDRGTPALYNESHGRDTDATNESAGLSRTIGWFTTLFPLLLRTLSTGSRIEDIVMAIKDEYHYASKGCIDEFAYQVLLEPTPSSFKRNDIELALNFAGRMQQVTHKDSLLRLRTDGPPVHLENVTGECESVGLLSFYAYIDEDEKLTLTLDYNSHMAHQDRIVRWMKEELGNCFTEMMSALSARSFNLTASDLPLLNMSSGPASVEYLHSQLEDLGVAHDNVESIYPCTATQDGILFSQLNGYDYHNRFVARLTSSEGDVDMTRTADAWKGACQAHPILRTIFTTGLSDQSAFQQIVLKKCQPFVSVREMPTDGSTISAVVASQEKMPLNSKQPPHKLTLYRESASVIHAVVDVSHVLADAKTFQDLFHTIGLAYSKTVGGGTPVVAPGRPFSDYVEWLRGQQEEASKYWRNYLQGVKPCVFPRDPAATVDYEARGPVVPFHDGQRLSRFCQEQAVTHAMFMQAAWALVLRKYTGNSTVCFGSVRSDQEVLPSNGGSADILGPLISMLPCRFDMQHLDSVTIRDVLETARNDSVRSMSYSGCYLAELHDELGLRDSPLFDTIMTIQRAWSNDLGDGSGHLSIEITDADDPTEYSVVVGVQYSENGLTIRLSHQRARVSDSMIQDIAETFAGVIEYMLQGVDQPVANHFKSSSPTLQLDLLRKWNANPPVATAPDENIPSFFRGVAQSQGPAPAVCSWECDLTYSELDLLSDRLAYKLRVEHNVQADDIVPFCCVKAASAVVVMLAIWKAGAGLLPLDFSHPKERLSAILQETEAKLLLVNATERVEKMSCCFPNGTVDLIEMEFLEEYAESDDVIGRELSSYQIEPQHAGYVVYTSGSTGQPKGLILHHRSLATSTMYHAPRLGLTSESRVLQLTNFVFDFGLLDVMFSLYAGACICMPSEEEATNDVGGAIRRTRANYVECTPTYASLFSPQDAPSLQTVVLAGEAMKQENMDTWASHVRLMNAYGPGETGMSSCGDVVIDEDGSFSQDIGAPFGCRYWVVDPDDHDELVPIGTTGELVIEGPIVGRGYVNKPESTAAAFIDPPAWTKCTEFGSIELGQHRFYKSGDLVIQRSKDSFVFDGRKDYQVKIRGQRIEMGEIEHHLNQQTLGVSKWAVEVIQTGETQEKSLAAFCQISSDGSLSPDGQNVLSPSLQMADKAREGLRQAVPVYMIPEFFIPLMRIPTTGSMKTDRKALREIAGSLSQTGLMSYRVTGQRKTDVDLEDRTTAVPTRFESVLRQFWADVLDISAQSIKSSDDFFTLGGNSIRAMRLVAALRKSGYLLSVAEIFKVSTLTEMALRTCSLAHNRNDSAPIPVAIKAHGIPRLQILAKTRQWLDTSNIEAIVPATDLQALMLSEAHHPDGGGMVATITIEPLAERDQQGLDIDRLQTACKQVIRCHTILRTVFIHNGQCLLQLVLRHPPVNQVHVLQPGRDSTHRVSASSDMLDILPHFDLRIEHKGTTCLGLTLTIHHAHYDAISIGHLLEDLKNAYNGTKILPRQPSFHEWSSHVSNTENIAESRGFWQDLLKDSMIYPLASKDNAKQNRFGPNGQEHCAFMKIPAANLKSPNGTPATVLKAAWSCVLSLVLEKQDLVFSFLSANRFLGTISHGSAEQVPGPCINLVPVRAFTGEPDKTMAMLIKDLQEQSNESLMHQHLGFRSIVRDCTEWPTTRFNSAVLFQNHEAFDQTLNFGDAECTIIGTGQGTNSADVWITATPQSDQIIGIELRFSQSHVPAELCQWISHCLESLLNSLPRWWERRLCQIQGELVERFGPNPVSPVESESYIPRSNGTDLEDVVDRVLQAGYFEYV